MTQHNNEPHPEIKTAPRNGVIEAIPFDETEPLSDSEPGNLGIYVAFALMDGRILELHVPHATKIVNGGQSNATVLSYFLINTDLSIEASGSMILVGAEA